MVGEVKYLPDASGSKIILVRNELCDYLSIIGEVTSDWGHDFGYGLIYAYRGEKARKAEAMTDYWETERIFITRMSGS